MSAAWRLRARGDPEIEESMLTENLIAISNDELGDSPG